MDFNLEAMTEEELNALLAAVQAKLEQLEKGEGAEGEEGRDGEPEGGAEGEEAADANELIGQLSDDLDELEQLVEDITARKATIQEKAEKRSKLIERIKNGQEGTVIRTFNDKQEERKMFGKETKEYREAWLKNLQGKPVTTEERAALTSAGAVIPTEMQNKIWDKLRENPLFGEIDFMHIPSYVTLPRAKTVNDATWREMSEESVDSEDEVDNLVLGAKKLIKTIEIEADIEAMSIPAFENWLVNKLVEKMQTAICAAVIAGAGTTKVPQGVTAAGAGAIAQTAAFTIAGLGLVMGALKSAYHKNAVWVMSSETFFGTIMPLAADMNGTLVMNGIETRLLGHKVVFDDNVGAKIVFGDFHDGYAWNFAKDIEIARDTSVGFRKGSTVFRSMALCDGGVVQGEAFVVATKSA